MAEELVISDMFMMELTWQNSLLTIIKESDHLLRRFGQVDVVKISQESSMEVWRHKADEIWALVSGQAMIHLEDLRDESPSRGVMVDVEISEEAPKAVLVPFGVSCKVSSGGGALFLRIGTHQDQTHPEDRTLFM